MKHTQKISSDHRDKQEHLTGGQSHFRNNKDTQKLHKKPTKGGDGACSKMDANRSMLNKWGS